MHKIKLSAMKKDKEKKQKKEKKEKKKKIKVPLTPKQIAIGMAIIALVSFLYKFTIGIMSLSMVLIIAAVPTLFVFICKFLYARHMDTTRAKKKRSYFFMMIATVCFVVLFLMFSLLKVGGIDITHHNTFTGWIGIVFILFIIVMFVLSIINLRGALQKDDLVVIGIKEISFVAALADAVMINGFLYRVLIKYIEKFIPFYSFFNQYFPLAVSILMCIVPIIMLRRFIKYKVDEEENVAVEEAVTNNEENNTNTEEV